MFHVKHPAALGAGAAHQEEVRAGSSLRFALRTLRPAPSSPAPARDPRTQRASARMHPFICASTASHHFASRGSNRFQGSLCNFFDFVASFRVENDLPDDRSTATSREALGKPLVGAFGGFLNLPRSRKSCREARFFYSSCTSGRLAEGPLPSEYASHETPRRRCRRHAA